MLSKYVSIESAQFLIRYGGMKPVVVVDAEKPMNGVEEAGGEESSGRRSSTRATENRDLPLCPACHTRHLPRPILKRRMGPHPEPRQGGRRAKRKVRISKVVKVLGGGKTTLKD